MEYIQMLCTKLRVSADWLLGLKAAEPDQSARKLEGLRKALAKLLKEY
jgi:hypothetical protein